MPNYECATCNREFRHERPGRMPERCPECAKKRNREYMREYMRERNKRQKFQALLNNPVLIEQVTKDDVQEPDWDGESIPDEIGDLFGHHFHDSGTGIDQGCFER